MNNPSRSHVAVRYTRMLLVELGLQEDEADRLLDRLRLELAEGSLDDNEARLHFLERELAQIKAMQGRKPPDRGRVMRIIFGGLSPLVGGVVSGVVASAVYDLIKSEFASPKVSGPAIQAPKPAEEWLNVILIEWAGTKHISSIFGANLGAAEPAFRRALHLRQHKYGAIDKRTATSLDGLAMLLEAQGKHREAETLRRQCLRIVERIHGSVHESTAAALSNLGLCLVNRGKYNDGNRCLARAYKVMIDCAGMQNLSTAAAILNVYYAAKAQGYLSDLKLPRQFVQAQPQISQMANHMMVRKYILVTLDVLREVLGQLREMTGQ